MNARRKGNRTQLKCIELLEQAGFLVNKVEVGGKFEKSKDLFGLFDLCGIREDALVMAQVTSNNPHPHNKYLTFSKQYSNLMVLYQQCVWFDKPGKPRGWKIFTYQNGEKHTEDLRK